MLFIGAISCNLSPYCLGIHSLPYFTLQEPPHETSIAALSTYASTFSESIREYPHPSTTWTANNEPVSHCRPCFSASFLSFAQPQQPRILESLDSSLQTTVHQSIPKSFDSQSSPHTPHPSNPQTFRLGLTHQPYQHQNESDPLPPHPPPRRFRQSPLLL